MISNHLLGCGAIDRHNQSTANLAYEVQNSADHEVRIDHVNSRWTLIIRCAQSLSTCNRQRADVQERHDSTYNSRQRRRQCLRCWQDQESSRSCTSLGEVEKVGRDKRQCNVRLASTTTTAVLRRSSLCVFGCPPSVMGAKSTGGARKLSPLIPQIVDGGRKATTLSPARSTVAAPPATHRSNMTLNNKLKHSSSSDTACVPRGGRMA